MQKREMLRCRSVRLHAVAVQRGNPYEPQARNSMLKNSYRTLTIRFRTRVVTCHASCIYANRDLFELIFQPASSSKNPRYKRTGTDLWRPNSGGGYMAASLRSY